MGGEIGNRIVFGLLFFFANFDILVPRMIIDEGSIGVIICCTSDCEEQLHNWIEV